ncbi:acyl-CoA dehydrogenase family protein [Pseudonocardia spinosispora]|uniref:acyl-CoA dehydrogenase family protein n=1 Tax=Pseudonocardia spinosispora TaxID=103441 RepID=UPI00042537C4|nr:acyl-CoA dehydrogenase family protein [Pseudonocardia spinosispora]
MSLHLPPSDTSDLKRRTDTVAKVAASAADDVDRTASFPEEAMAALREQGLLRPGPGAEPGRYWSAREVLAVSATLGQACASTAMIWAMHQGQLLSVARQRTATEAARSFVDAAWHSQPLVASLMSERRAVNPRHGNAACTDDGPGRIVIEKDVSVASYLDRADAALVVARRSPDAPLTDQLLVLADRSEVEVTKPTPWLALGMRGTASGGCSAVIRTSRANILPDTFSETSAHTTTPLTHIGWAGCWWGIARAAVDRSRRYLQTPARSAGELAAVKAVRLARLTRLNDQIRSEAVALADVFDAEAGTRESSGALQVNNLRLSVAETASTVVLEALEVIGIDAYREREASRFSLSRHLRDVVSARVMMSADRLQLANATFARLPDDDPFVAAGLRD